MQHSDVHWNLNIIAMALNVHDSTSSSGSFTSIIKNCRCFCRSTGCRFITAPLADTPSSTEDPIHLFKLLFCRLLFLWSITLLLAGFSLFLSVLIGNKVFLLFAANFVHLFLASLCLAELLHDPLLASLAMGPVRQTCTGSFTTITTIRVPKLFELHITTNIDPSGNVVPPFRLSSWQNILWRFFGQLNLHCRCLTFQRFWGRRSKLPRKSNHLIQQRPLPLLIVRHPFDRPGADNTICSSNPPHCCALLYAQKNSRLKTRLNLFGVPFALQRLEQNALSKLRKLYSPRFSSATFIASAAILSSQKPRQKWSSIVDHPTKYWMARPNFTVALCQRTLQCSGHTLQTTNCWLDCSIWSRFTFCRILMAHVHQLLLHSSSKSNQSSLSVSFQDAILKTQKSKHLHQNSTAVLMSNTLAQHRNGKRPTRLLIQNCRNRKRLFRSSSQIKIVQMNRWPSSRLCLRIIWSALMHGCPSTSADTVFAPASVRYVADIVLPHFLSTRFGWCSLPQPHSFFLKFSMHITSSLSLLRLGFITQIKNSFLLLWLCHWCCRVSITATFKPISISTISTWGIFCTDFNGTYSIDLFPQSTEGT